MSELHTYIKCTKCGYDVRASLHSKDECEGWKKFGKTNGKKHTKIIKNRIHVNNINGDPIIICTDCDSVLGLCQCEWRQKK